MDEPFIHQAEDQLGFTAPAGWVAVGVWLHMVKYPFLLQILKDLIRDFGDMFAGEPFKLVNEVTLFGQRGHPGQGHFLGELEVLCAAAGGDMDNAGAFILTHLIPEYHPVGFRCAGRNPFLEFFQLSYTANNLGGREFIKGTVVGPTFHFSAFDFFQDLILPPEHVYGALGEINDVLLIFIWGWQCDLHLQVVQLGTDSSGHIGGQGPGGGGPNQQGFSRAFPEREAQGHRTVGEFRVAVSDYFVLADGCGAAGAPGHHVRSPI